MTSRIDSTPASRATTRSQPKAMPPCGGAPNLKPSRRKPNFVCGVCLVQAHQLEDPFLDVALVDTDGAAADFVAVADDVVGVGQGRFRVLVEGVHELGLGRGEGVVHGGPLAGTDGHVAGGHGGGGRLEHRRVHDPARRPSRWG